MNIGGSLGYSTCLMVISHDNWSPAYIGFLSGTESYYGIHGEALHTTNTVTVTSGVKGDGKLKIKCNTSGAQLISIIPIGNGILPLSFEYIS